MQKHYIHIGTSGWSYKHWRGTFYPDNLKIKDQFKYYVQQFHTVELNNTFYRLPKKEVFIKWKNEVPADFLFVIKASRYITHMKRLQDPSESLTLFLSNVALLEEKLGAILFQLPPGLGPEENLLSDFLNQLPKSHRYVFEFRNPGWYQQNIYSLLKKHNCAICIYELDGYLSPQKITADFVYIRLHGPGKKYQGNYSKETLEEWADLIKKWHRSKDVFVYFDNDEKGYAAFNAKSLIELLG